MKKGDQQNNWNSSPGDLELPSLLAIHLINMNMTAGGKLIGMKRKYRTYIFFFILHILMAK